MNKAIRTAGAIFGAFAITLASIAPASATSSFTSVTIDCATDLSNDEYATFPFFATTDEITVTLVGCSDYGLTDLEDSEHAALGASALDSIVAVDIDTDPATLTITGPLVVTFTNAGEPFDTVEFVDVQTVPNPTEASLLDTSTAEIPTGTLDFTYGTEQEITEGQELTPGDGCFLIAGSHVYSTATLTVGEYGNYTMRVIGQDPSGDWFHQDDPYQPWDDSVILAYSDFDPTDIEANLLSCGDEIWADDFGLETSSWYQTEDNQPLSGSWPYFEMELDPGTYTLVYATYFKLSSDQWSVGTDDYGMWDPATVSITTELWGPEGGATLVSETEQQALDASLASTGVDPSFGLWTGLALAGTGVAITVARRRAQRA